MNTITKQSIAQSIRENFQAYPDSYPCQSANNGTSATEDAVSALINWVETEYEQSDDEDKGSVGEWFQIAVDSFISYFEICDGDFDDGGEAREHIVNLVKEWAATDVNIY